jgi:5-methyltetrahydrofolate--homocysteine methyltransferase
MSRTSSTTRRPDATDRLVSFAATFRGRDEARARPLVARGVRSASGSSIALVHGIVDFIEEDTEEARTLRRGRST